MIFEKEDFEILEYVFKAARVQVAADEPNLIKLINFKAELIKKMKEADNTTQTHD